MGRKPPQGAVTFPDNLYNLVAVYDDVAVEPGLPRAIDNQTILYYQCHYNLFVWGIDF